MAIATTAEARLVSHVMSHFYEEFQRRGFLTLNKNYWHSKLGNEFVSRNAPKVKNIADLSSSEWEDLSALSFNNLSEQDRLKIHVFLFGSRFQRTSRRKILKFIQDRCSNTSNTRHLGFIWNSRLVNALEVTSLASYLETAKRQNGSYFRGQANVAWDRTPSIYRYKNRTENEFFYKTITNRPQEFTQCNSTFEQLVKMQHYSIPTRLLDVSENPIISLFFSCENGNDGQVGCVFEYKNVTPRKVDGETVSMISSLAKMDEEFTEAELEWRIKEEKPNFKITPGSTSRILDQVVVIQPKRDNARIIQQQGSFLLCGEKVNKQKGSTYYKKTGPSLELERIHQHSKVFLIEPAIKIEILTSLAWIGIDKSYIYPEIEHFAELLKA